MGNPHILAISYPAQGHVIPLMELALCLSKHGLKVTFVNTDFVHNQVMSAFSDKDNVEQMVNLVSIPDGMEPWEDRNDLGKLTESFSQFMPGKLEELIQKKKGIENDEITCIIVDENMGWALEVAEKMGIKRAAFWPAAAATLGLLLKIPELIQSKVLDNNGTVLNSQMFSLSPTMPTMSTEIFAWAQIQDKERIIFQMVKKNNETVKLADWVICNTAPELEPGALALFPEILPIGPLLPSNRLGKSAGHFWPEDISCLRWLDQQPACSVIYAAFGSFTIFDQNQLEELALGLELTNRPFLWVVRPDMTTEMTKVYLESFEARVRPRGRLVSWAPQDRVLAHPSVCCFLSHCGWNSTMEGVSNGVPFLCWPYFTDQFLNQTYICDIWKVGLGFNKDKRGIITRAEINNKVKQLLDDKSFKTGALLHKEKAVSSVHKGGCSDKNMSNFIKWISAGDESVVP